MLGGPLGSACVVGLLAAGGLVAACGARTGLGSPGGPAAEGGGGSGGSGGAPERDASPPEDCVEAGITFVYLITDANDLLAFYPPTLAVSTIGTIACPTLVPGSQPFSMGVDRAGIAFVLFEDGEIFRVSTADASCQKTGFQRNQHGFSTFGMGFSSDMNDPDEQLYVAKWPDDTTPPLGLARIDLDAFALTPIGPFSQDLGSRMELTGTGDGKLYGYVLADDDSGGHVVEIDKSNAEILSSTALSAGNAASALAFAFWGGDFYIFTTSSSGTTTEIHRYSPSTHTDATVLELPGKVVVGAGVSTCAPAH